MYSYSTAGSAYVSDGEGWGYEASMKVKTEEEVGTSNSFLFAPALRGADTTPLPDFATNAASPSAGRYWRTLKHLRSSQLFYLVRHRILNRNKIGRWPEAYVALRTCPSQLKLKMAEWQPALARQIIQTGNVRFLEPEGQGPKQAPWWEEEIARRQIFHANYCDFLNVDLNGPEDSQLLRLATRIALSWCDQNPRGTEVGWLPFIQSLRIVNWLKYLFRNASRAEKIGDGAKIEQMLASLRVQMLSLESRLEKELLANHFLRNAKALVFAGALLEAPESDRWRSLGQQILREQIAEQILPDGGHIERSPMYHAWILDDLLDIHHLFEFCPPDSPECALEVSRCINTMGRYLSQVIHPDGEIALFNDSQLDVTRPTLQILSDAGAPLENSLQSGIEVKAMCNTGYATIRDTIARSFLIFDCGPLGPDYQPGHGHSDVLSYELTLQGQRVIVDTGVSSYERGPERHYERSTAAHNTIRVDGVEQAEIWGGFRVGRRPAVSPIHCGEISGCQFVHGTHFGYKHLDVVHSRAIVRLDGDSWVFVDTLSGKGRHKIESFIHFHPSIRLLPYTGSQISSPDLMVPRWVLEFEGLRYLFMVLGDGKLIQTQAWYSPGFAIRLSQSVIHWTLQGEVPARMLYAVVPEGSPPVRVGPLTDRSGIELNHVLVPL
jgi:uncharacterized heparinase superfamily protein